MKSILFVDDEPAVLCSLRRALSRERGRWSMAFAASAEAALAEIDKQRFDIVVSDLRMPGMDGVELLQLVASRQPTAVRIILSGNVEKAESDRAREAVHEVLSKPYPTAELRATLDRWLDARAVASEANT
jgi:CheY-like chemotaxis protein